jgi:hypothetical protein
MWKKFKLGPIAACALIIFAVAALCFIRSSSRRDLSIVFIGYTNSATGVPTANFSVSNLASRVLFVSKTGTVQLKIADEWKDWAPTNTGVIALLPDQTLFVTVARPTNGEAWRISMFSGRPRTSSASQWIRNVYRQQPFQFQPLSYLVLSPVLRHTATYSEEKSD